MQSDFKSDLIIGAVTLLIALDVWFEGTISRTFVQIMSFFG